MEKPTISIITVTYNCQDTLEETILSIINQTYSNIEYLVIDGGSTDGTVDIIKKYQDKISYWISEPDKGIYDAMNKGIDKATGEWVNFMNAGDRFVSETVTSSIFSRAIPNNISFLYSDFYILNNPTKKIEASYESGLLLHQSVFYKKRLHETCGNYIVTPKYIISDYFFFMQIPSNEVQKVNIPISINATAGVSAGEWCLYQKPCVDYFFRRISFFKLIKTLIYTFIKKNLASIFHKMFIIR